MSSAQPACRKEGQELNHTNKSGFSSILNIWSDCEYMKSHYMYMSVWGNWVLYLDKRQERASQALS